MAERRGAGPRASAPAVRAPTESRRSPRNSPIGRVRYWYDIAGKRRLKIVEIIVDEASRDQVSRQSNTAREHERPQTIVAVHVAFAEGALR